MNSEQFLIGLKSMGLKLEPNQENSLQTLFLEQIPKEKEAIVEQIQTEKEAIVEQIQKEKEQIQKEKEAMEQKALNDKENAYAEGIKTGMELGVDETYETLEKKQKLENFDQRVIWAKTFLDFFTNSMLEIENLLSQPKKKQIENDQKFLNFFKNKCAQNQGKIDIESILTILKNSCPFQYIFDTKTNEPYNEEVLQILFCNILNSLSNYFKNSHLLQNGNFLFVVPQKVITKKDFVKSKKEEDLVIKIGEVSINNPDIMICNEKTHSFIHKLFRGVIEENTPLIFELKKNISNDGELKCLKQLIMGNFSRFLFLLYNLHRVRTRTRG